MKAFLLTVLLSLGAQAHEMQHGFILSADSTHAEHLVADGHHSHQLSATVKLTITDPEDLAFYEAKVRANGEHPKYYFLFLAQKLDLPATKEGQVLRGPISMSALGDFQPKNIIVKDATLEITRIHVNVPNPFFGEEQKP